tara:strand:+ start:238 stop:843 length:606 start_codon:yes stop_codon:yes gene_type:complete
MSQIKLLHSGGNGVILAAPSSNPAADRTLTLPGDADGTIATTATAGKILQVVQTVKKDRFTAQSQTPVDITGLSVSITPSSASNKILVHSSVYVNGNAIYYAMRLARDSDNTIFIGDVNGSNTSQTRATFGGYMASTMDTQTIVTSYLDSPNTTSATTYKMQVYSPYSSSYVVGINSTVALDNYGYVTNGTSSITVMEVAT